jgi:transglutaminase-like putative cysteine protease
MRFRVTHTTTYHYTAPVSLCLNVVRLTPRSGPRQECHANRLIIDPLPAVLHPHVDYFGNHTTFFTVQEPHRRLMVTAESEGAWQTSTDPVAEATPPWETVRNTLAENAPALFDACQFAFESHHVPISAELAAYAAPSFTPDRPILEGAMDLMARIHHDFRFDPTATTVSTPVHEVLTHRRGVCQDFAHLQIGCLRSLGLSARYVSGYLVTRPPPGRPRLVGADASHAWLSIYCPDLGWVDLDPTNNMLPGERHITLAWGRDYDDVSPTRGVIIGGGRQSISVGVTVIAAEQVEEVPPEEEAPALDETP